MTGFLLAAEEQLPADVGKSGPLGLLLMIVLLIATVLLVRSMSRHLKGLPRSFDERDEERVVIPDTPAELLEERRREPGQDLLDTLRRAPLAIEPPHRDSGAPNRRDGDAPNRRDGDGRPGTPRSPG